MLANQSGHGMGDRAGSPPGTASGPPSGPVLSKSPSAPRELHTRQGLAWLFELMDPVCERASVAWKKAVLLVLDVSTRKRKKKPQTPRLESVCLEG